MTTQRLSFDMPIEDHKKLKIMCAEAGISIKDFILDAVDEYVTSQEYLNKRQREIENANSKTRTSVPT